jgi:hypothetical protein
LEGFRAYCGRSEFRMSLALATLVHEWRRYLAAVLALAFSGLLVLAQVGMFTGIVHAVTATIDRSRAEIVIMPPSARAWWRTVPPPCRPASRR